MGDKQVDIVELVEEGDAGGKSHTRAGSKGLLSSSIRPTMATVLVGSVVLVLLIVVIALASAIAQRPILYLPQPAAAVTVTPTPTASSPAPTVPVATPTAAIPTSAPVKAVNPANVRTLLMQGNLANGRFGRSIASPDVNLDGLADLVVGAPVLSSAYVLLGYAPIYVRNLTLAFDVTPPLPGQGTVIHGASPVDLTGSAVASGDVDNDGIADVVLGALLAGPSKVGTVTVLYSSLSLYSTTPVLLLPPANTSIGFTVQGPSILAQTGASLAAQDFNGDGYADLLIGCPNATIDGYSTYPGAVYVLWGSPRASLPANATVSLASLTPQQGLIFVGGTNGDHLGVAVAALGDINQDGYNDFAMGSPSYKGNWGAVYVVFGGPAAHFQPRTNVYSISKSTGFVVYGRAGDLLGAALAPAGDVNNDGFPDVILGAPGDITVVPVPTGSVGVILGAPKASLAASVSMAGLNGANGFLVTGTNPGDRFGSAVGAAGDYNLDGAADYLVGAAEAIAGTGAVYLVYGQTASTLTASAQVSSTWIANNGMLFTANQTTNPGLGLNVWGNFDFNGDGRADFAYGQSAEDVDFIGAHTGEIFVIFNAS